MDDYVEVPTPVKVKQEHFRSLEEEGTYLTIKHTHLEGEHDLIVKEGVTMDQLSRLSRSQQLKIMPISPCSRSRASLRKFQENHMLL